MHIFNNLIADLLSRGHSVRFQAKGKSMHPAIQEGEGIGVAPVEPSQVKRGDIILYRIQSGLIAHRVVALTPHYSFILRGDASVSCDKPVAPQQILGKVVCVERDGRRVKLDTKIAKMLHQTRLWTSRLRRAIKQLAISIQGGQW